MLHTHTHDWRGSDHRLRSSARPRPESWYPWRIIRAMKAREACAESPYQVGVRYSQDGKPMIFGQPHGRAFVETLSETGRPVFQEVKRKYVENVLNYSDWKPWTGPLRLEDILPE